MSRAATHEDGITDEDDELAIIADPEIDDDLAAELVAVEPESCDAEVWERPSYFHRHNCTNPGKRWVGGKWLCGVHARAADRREARRWR